MKLHRLRLVALSSVPLLAAACAGESEPRGLELAVAPLELEGIGQACYDIRVTNKANRAGETVWSKGTPGHQVPAGGAPDKFKSGDADAICSGQYGNARGGDITYIGSCDADGQEHLKLPRVGTGWTPENPTDATGERVNSVTLWFDGLYDAAGNYIVPTGEDGWQDPCPNGCTLDVLCEENADNLVEFNFTVMRDAQQGFFDIAVNFEDIFCSAKFDSCSGGTEAPGDVPPRVIKGATIAEGWVRDLVLYPYETAAAQGQLAKNRSYVFDLETNQDNEPTPGGTSRGWFRADAAKFDDGSITARDILFVDKASTTTPPREIRLANNDLISAVQRPQSKTPNTLLFGQDGERDHTAVATLACTAGPDSSASGTTLVFDVPTIKCYESGPNPLQVWFKLDKLDTSLADSQGEGGNQIVDASSGPGLADDYALRYGLYYDKEDLTCPPQAATDGRFYYTTSDGKKAYYAKRNATGWTVYASADDTVVLEGVSAQGTTPPATINVSVGVITLANSCNKVFYNIGFNIADLAEQGLQGCVFEWSGTALETSQVKELISNTGAFLDPNGVYPGIEYKGIVLTGRAAQVGEAFEVKTMCSQNPLNGNWSNVRTGYLKGSAFGEGGGYETDYASDGLTTKAFAPPVSLP